MPRQPEASTILTLRAYSPSQAVQSIGSTAVSDPCYASGGKKLIVDERELIRRGACNFGNKKAIVYKAGKPSVIEGISLTFTEVNERANKLANALRVLGLDPGTRVGTLAQNCLEYTEIMFGLIKGGFPRTILNPMLAAKEIQFQIDHSKSSVVILQHRYAQMIHSIRDQLPNVKHLISFDGKDENMLDYEALLDSASDREPKKPSI